METGGPAHRGGRSEEANPYRKAAGRATAPLPAPRPSDAGAQGSAWPGLRLACATRRSSALTRPLPAPRLRLPCLSAILELKCQGSGLQVLRKSDRGARQRVLSQLPCALLVEADSCEPRYPGQQALMEAATAPIEQWGLAELGLPTTELGMAVAKLGKGQCAFPRPNPRRVETPDAALPAFERILALLSGGIKPRAGKLHSLSAQQTAESLLRVLRGEGLLGGETR